MTADRVPDFFKRTSALSDEEILSCRRILGESQPFGIYFNAALADLKSGQDNRWFHLSRAGGLTMGIDFDDLRVFSVIGAIDDDVLSVMGTNPRRTEFHVPHHYADALRARGDTRFLREHKLRYYSLKRDRPFHESFQGLRRLSMQDFTLVEQFYSRHYDGTIFSSWMLEQPFWGLFGEGHLLAAGGAIVIDKIGKAANIGNFLTAPDHRGNGFGKMITKRVINDVMDMGIDTFTLGTTEENVPAWKTYESVGFRLLEQRTEIEISSF